MFRVLVMEEYIQSIMTIDIAKEIKSLRAHALGSWRVIADRMYYTFPELNKGHQMDGRVLCNEAAKKLGEDASSDPWN